MYSCFVSETKLKGISVMDKGEVLEPSDPSASHKLSIEFTSGVSLLRHSH